MNKKIKSSLAALTIALHVLTFSGPLHAQDIYVQAGTVLEGDVHNLAGSELNYHSDGPAGLRGTNFFNAGDIKFFGPDWFTAFQNTINSGHITATGNLLMTTLGVDAAQFFAGIASLNQNPEGPGRFVNTGSITAQGQWLAVAAGTFKNLGTLSAGGGVVGISAGSKNVTFPLSADGAISMEVRDTITADVYDKDGKKVSDVWQNGGLIQGSVVIVKARGAEKAFDNIINHTGIIEAQTIGEKDGKIVLDGGNQGVVRVDGKLDASGYAAGGKGGTVEVTGEKIRLDSKARIDVSGDAGGGEVYVGISEHDFSGPSSSGGPSLTVMPGDPASLPAVSGDLPILPLLERIQSGVPMPSLAKAVYMDPGAEIHADAITRGNGGRTVLWAGELTHALGTITARGGALSGNGGFIETSAGQLDVEGIEIDASALNGTAGKWLLDPYNVTIGLVGAGTLFGGVFTPVTDNSKISASTIKSALEGGTSVEINTGTSGTQEGDLTVNAAISTTGVGPGVTLTLKSARDTLVHQDINDSGSLSLKMSAGRDILMDDGTVAKTETGKIDFTAGRDISLSSVQTGSNASDAVRLTAETGEIRNSGHTNPNILTGPDGIATLTAATGIGSNQTVTYQLENSTDLVHWTTIASQSTNKGTDSFVTPNVGHGFFRVLPIGKPGVQISATAGVTILPGNKIQVSWNRTNGVVTDRLETQVGQLSAITAAGDVQLHNTGDLKITSANGVAGVTIDDRATGPKDPGSEIFVTASGKMSIDSPITNYDGGNVNVYTVGGAAADSMDINANVSSQGGNGNVRLVSGGDMNMASGTTVSAAGSGSVTLGAGYDTTGKLPGDSNATLLNAPTNKTANMNMSPDSNVTTENGDILADVTHDLNLGHFFAPNGHNTLNVGGSIFSPGGPEIRVTGNDLIKLTAGGVIGTASNPIETHLNHPGNLLLQAGGQQGPLSVNVQGNFTRDSVNLLSNPPGLAAFNGLVIGGEPVQAYEAGNSNLFDNPNPVNLPAYGQFDRRHSADFPPFFDQNRFAFAPATSINTSGIDVLPIEGLGILPTVIPLPGPAVPPTPTPEAERPPLTVPLPGPAQAPEVQPAPERSGPIFVAPGRGGDAAALSVQPKQSVIVGDEQKEKKASGSPALEAMPPLVVPIPPSAVPPSAREPEVENKNPPFYVSPLSAAVGEARDQMAPINTSLGKEKIADQGKIATPAVMQIDVKRSS